jgi:hypothetical protein
LIGCAHAVIQLHPANPLQVLQSVAHQTSVFLENFLGCPKYDVPALFTQDKQTIAADPSVLCGLACAAQSPGTTKPKGG